MSHFISESYRHAARDVFGFTTLRSEQEDAFAALATGHDCLIVQPTGSGKSLCYALPAVVDGDGLTLVISPLIALMEDQIQRFRAVGIACGAVHSMQTHEERLYVWNELRAQRLRLLLLSPERLSQPEFRLRLLETNRIRRIAIDEAHCISQWGSHFRPEYRKLMLYLKDFPGIQKVALTATATQRTRQDIIESLAMIEPKIIVAHPVRPNLRTKILRFSATSMQYTALLNAVLDSTGHGLIYASTRKQVDELTRMLKNAGVEATAYHAGMHHTLRSKSQDEFCSGATKVVVATNAFGMGIDKADIRFVFHCGVPSTLEAYMQEIGRAGRDGLPSDCTLFYSGRDIHIQKFLIKKSFPEVDVMASVLAQISMLFKQQPTWQEGPLVRELLRLPKVEDGPEMLMTLLKEGFLARSGGEQLVLNGDAAQHGSYLRSYALRRDDQLAKLKTMEQFLYQDVRRDKLLKSYFGI